MALSLLGEDFTIAAMIANSILKILHRNNVDGYHRLVDYRDRCFSRLAYPAPAVAV